MSRVLSLRSLKITWMARAPRAGALGAVACAFMLSACEVTNPGPIADGDLNDETAHAALVNGAGARFLAAYNQVAYTGAIVSRELLPGGQTGNYGHSSITQGGHIPGAGGEILTNVHFDFSHQARFIAEEALRRFASGDAGTVDAEVLAQAYVWAGFINRMLGANMCEAVFDGGAAEPVERHLERAEEQFGNAVGTGGDLEMAALAGRAATRAHMGDWAGAASDAAQVPDGFNYYLSADGTERNKLHWIYWANANKPYRAYSVWMTWFDSYYADTGDPRTPWGIEPNAIFDGGALAGFGQVTRYVQLKYTDTGGADDYRIAGGTEMRLLQAESMLINGEWEAAMDMINGVRTVNISDNTGDPLEAWVANNATEAWVFLKRERAIELWLEGRRFEDLRRWESQGAPGEVDWPDFESLTTLFTDNPRSDCFPISDNERDTNPNI